MSLRRRLGALLGVLVVLGSAACSEPDESTGVVKPKTGTSPSAAPSSGGLTGGVGGDGSLEPVVQYVRLDASTLSLNVPTAPGLAPAGLPATGSLGARVVLADGQPDPSGVEWQIQDPSRLSVDSSGVLTVRADAPVGVTSVTAISKRTPTIKAQAAITITRDGVLEFKGLTMSGSGYVRANITKNGAFLVSERLDDPPRVRLPADGPYEVQLQRVAGSDSSVLGEFTDLSVRPNALTVATASF